MSTPSPTSAPYGTLGTRFVARVLDAIIVSIPVPIAYAVLFLVDPTVGMILVLVAFLFNFYNLLWLGGRKGQTLGRRAVGLWVLDVESGQPLGAGRFFLRELVLGLITAISCYLAPLVNLFLAANDPRRQMWHDKAVRSVVLTNGPDATAPVSKSPEARTAGVVPVGLPPVPPPPPALATPTSVPTTPEPLADPEPTQNFAAVTSLPVPPPPGIVLAPPGPPVTSPAPPPAPPLAATVEPADFDPHTRAVRRNRGGWRLESAGGSNALSALLLVGRDPDSGLFDGADRWAIADPEMTVSKTHALFAMDEGSPFVEDLDSTNGVVVVRSGKETQLAPRTRTPLQDADVVLLGEYELTVVGGA